MIRRWLALAVVLLMHEIALAQSAPQDCLSIHERDARLNCWDSKGGYVPPAASPAASAPTAPPAADGAAAAKPDASGGESRTPHFHVRDDVSFDTVAVLKDGKKAASVQLTRNDGKHASTAKVAVLYGFDAYSHDSPIVQALPMLRGWQGFTGVGWIRDPAAKTPKDQREVALGIIGANFDGKVSTLTSAKLGRRHENFSDTDTTIANLHVNLVVLDWVTQVPEPGRTWHLPVPYFGLFAEDRASAKAGSVTGLLNGAYLGWKHSAKLLAINDRLSLNAQLQHYRDFHAPAGQAERRKNYGSVGLSYALPSPETAWFVPSIELKYERGTDPVTGLGPVRKTTLGLGIKVN